MNSQKEAKILTENERRIAYFSMEIGIDASMPTYSGGLGVLAGDTVKSCADLNVPFVGVSLLYKKGYFTQVLDKDGNQNEKPCEWPVEDKLELLDKRITIKISGRDVVVQPWLYKVTGVGGFIVPIILMDTDLEENDEQDRKLSHFLYGGDEKTRLSQEILLGIGGVKMLQELGYNNIIRYHMNEGHAALLTLYLLKRNTFDIDISYGIDRVKKMCVFTTHTIVPAGHDKFSYDLVKELLGDYIPVDMLKRFGGDDELNMTLLAMNLSHYINGVAKKHCQVTREMFKDFDIDSITNGVHSHTWLHGSFKKLFNKYTPDWNKEPSGLRNVLAIPNEEVWSAHMEAKRELINYVNQHASKLDPEIFTIGFARRSTGYKRADLLFSDIDSLLEIHREVGAMQIIFAGKAHPRDYEGKEIIKRIVSRSKELKKDIKIVYLSNYNIELAQKLVAGVDLWLNTPLKPNEASGTSGMKAAHNGVPSLSVLDGWWIEGCIEGVTGWSLGSFIEDTPDSDKVSLYNKLKYDILPVFYGDRQKWVDIMKNTVAINAAYFNTNRMVMQYIVNAYIR